MLEKLMDEYDKLHYQLQQAQGRPEGFGYRNPLARHKQHEILERLCAKRQEILNYDT